MSFDHILDLDVQFVLMGTGDQHYHDLFRSICSQTYAQRAAVFLTFDQALAAEGIYAGCDLFLMPSRGRTMPGAEPGWSPCAMAPYPWCEPTGDWRIQCSTGTR